MKVSRDSANSGEFTPNSNSEKTSPSDDAPGGEMMSRRAAEAFLELARLAAADPDPQIRKKAELFDGFHWVAVGQVAEATRCLAPLRQEFPEADRVLKKLEFDRLGLLNRSALETWELFQREAELAQQDLDRGHLARFFSNETSLAAAREKRFGPERKLIQELKRRLDQGECATLAEGLGQIQEHGPEELKELSGFLLSNGAKNFEADPRPALIAFASSPEPDRAIAELLLQRNAELGHQSDPPTATYAINILLQTFGPEGLVPAGEGADRSSSEHFAAALLKLGMSANAEGVAGDVGLMLASAGLGNLAKVATFARLRQAGMSLRPALALTGAAGIAAESTVFWAGNTAKAAALHDPEQVLQWERMARHYGATVVMMTGMKGFAKLGEDLGPRAAKALNLLAETGELSVGGEAMVRGFGHAAGLNGLIATNQLNRELGLQETSASDLSEAAASDLFSYVEFALAHRMASNAWGGPTAPKSPPPAPPPHLFFRSRARDLGLSPLWMFLGSGGIGGGIPPSAAKPSSLRESLRADPDNVELRQVYADYLLEQGDPRGELINLQLSAAKDDPGRKQERILAAQIFAPKAKQLKDRLVGYEFQGGFLHRLAVKRPSAKFLQEIWQGEDGPFLRQVEISALQDRTLSHLLAQPEIAQLTHLGLKTGVGIGPDNSGIDIGAAGARSLAESPRLANLTHLGLKGMRIGVSGARALANSPHLQKLTSLGLNYNELGDGGVATLARSANFSELSDLDLEGNSLGNTGLADLASSPYVTKLARLNLKLNQIDDAGLRALAGSANFAQLRYLNLSYNKIGSSGIQALAESPHLTHLTELNLQNIELNPEGAQDLARSPNLANVTDLDLATNPIGNAGLAAIAQSPHLSNLHHLNLFATGITDEGVLALANSPHLSKLSHLELSERISPAAAETLFHSPHLPNLTRITIGDKTVSLPSGSRLTQNVTTLVRPSR